MAAPAARQEGRRPGWYKWLVVALFWCAFFLNQADRQVIFAVFPLVERDLGLSQTELGLTGSLFFWVYGLTAPLAGAIGDRFSRKRILVTALLVWSAATLGSGAATGFVMLLALRALTGAGEAFYFPSANSIITDYHGAATRATAMSLHLTALYFGIITSGWLAGWLGERYGWRAAFGVFGAAGIGFALILARLLAEPPRGLSEQGGAAARPVEAAGMSLAARVRETVRRPTAVALIFVFVCMNFVNAAYLPWMTKLLYERFDYGLAAAGFHATFWHHAGAFLGVLAGGRLADRLAARSRLSRPLVQAAGLFGGAPFIFLLGWAEWGAAVFAGMALFGVFRGLYDSNLLASLYEVVRPEARATATGMFMAAGFLFGGTASVIVGSLSQRLGLGMALASTSLAYVVGGLTLLAACALWFRRDAERVRAAVGAAEVGTAAA
jgi:MFS transporter, Spinster family, sphingosine-1-phosphate transporter